jgi:hypothetical protein
LTHLSFFGNNKKRQKKMKEGEKRRKRHSGGVRAYILVYGEIIQLNNTTVHLTGKG